MSFEYKTQGTCSQRIFFDIVDGKVINVQFQGVTTEVSGQCGYSPFPSLPERLSSSTSELDGDDDWYCASFDDFVKRFEASKYEMAVNQASLVGHGSLRAGVIGYEDRQVTPEELEQMKTLPKRIKQNWMTGSNGH